MTEDQARNMAKAAQLWLDYQVLCGREMLLSESYLAQPVGEYIRNAHSGPIHAEWNHPNLNRAGRGRPRQIDYVTLSRDAEIPKAAVEVKWASEDGQVSRQRLLDDLLRLECVRSDEGQAMFRYFLLAGKKNAVQNYLDLAVNTGGGRQPFTAAFLPCDDGEVSVRVRECEDYLRRFFKSFGESYRTDLPVSFKSKLLVDRPGQAVRVAVWRISSARNRRSFSPAEWSEVQVPETESESE